MAKIARVVLSSVSLAPRTPQLDLGRLRELRRLVRGLLRTTPLPDGLLAAEEPGAGGGSAGERRGEGGEQGGGPRRCRSPRGARKSGGEHRSQRRVPVSAAPAAAHAYSLLHSAWRQAGAQAGVPSATDAVSRAPGASRAARADGGGLGRAAQRADRRRCAAPQPACQGCRAYVSAARAPPSRLHAALLPAAAASAASSAALATGGGGAGTRRRLHCTRTFARARRARGTGAGG